MTALQLKRIAIALAVLIVLWGAAELLNRPSDKTTAEFTLPALNSEDVDTVKLLRPKDTILLTKQGPTEWSVNGHAASRQAVTDLFKAVSGITQAELVARNPSSFAQLGVDSTKGKRLEFIHGGKTVANLIVGGRGPSYSGAYVRRPTEDAVYLLEGDLGSYTDRSLDDWRDRRIATLEPDSVREIEVRLGRGGYTLSRGDSGWMLVTGRTHVRADSGAVTRMLEQYRTLDAAGFATPAQADSFDFTHPNRRVTMSGTNQQSLADVLFDSTTSWWWVQRANGGPIYKLETWRMNQLFPGDSTLKAKPEVPKAQPDTAKPDSARND